MTDQDKLLPMGNKRHFCWNIKSNKITMKPFIGYSCNAKWPEKPWRDMEVGPGGRILGRNWDKNLRVFLLAIHSHLPPHPP
jgi:hypothetical protein